MTVHIKYVLNKITFFLQKKRKKRIFIELFFRWNSIGSKMDCRIEFQGRCIHFFQCPTGRMGVVKMIGEFFVFNHGFIMESI